MALAAVRVRLAEAVSIRARVWPFFTVSPTLTSTAFTVPEAPKASDDVRELARLPEPVTVAVSAPWVTVAVRVETATVDSVEFTVK